MTKKHLLYGIIPVLALTLLIGGTTYAASNKLNGDNPFNNLAEAIAKKFNLNTTDVQTVINDTIKSEQTEMIGQRGMMRNNKFNQTELLTQAVTDGKLTQAQADLITAKREEMKTVFESLKDKTPEARQESMKIQHDALVQWAKDNNIPEKYVIFGNGKGMGMNRGFHGENPKRNHQNANINPAQ